MARKPLIAGNWKMNLDHKEAIASIQKFESDPIVSQQPIMQQRYVPVGHEAATALQDPNVAAVPWLLDELRAGLELIPAS